MKRVRIFLVFLTWLLVASRIAAQHSQQSNQNAKTMTQATKTDKELLSELNGKFIKNFITMDTAAHNEIIHKDFVCIENSGAIVNRDDYMRDWATDYANGNFTSFSYTDEVIRIFGNMGLIRSKTVYIGVKDGKTVSGNSIYTDTYFKENGRWWCVQAQITPLK